MIILKGRKRKLTVQEEEEINLCATRWYYHLKNKKKDIESKNKLTSEPVKAKLI